MTKLYIAIDLGATNVRVAYGDEDGIKEKHAMVTEKRYGAEGVVSQIIRMVEALEVDEIAAIGVGSIGPLDLSKGCIIDTPNLPFSEIPIVEPLSEAFNTPVKLMNDCSAAVLAEQTYGNGRGMENIVYVTLSTGLGGGAMVDGHLLVGKDGNAVEIGHLTIDSTSELVCGCGCRGHWEAYCSGRNIPKFARLLMSEMGVDESHIIKFTEGEVEDFTTEALFEAASMGVPLAQWLVEKIGEVNAIGFANLVNAYDPELITVGGSIALCNPVLILKPIEQNIDRHLINRRPEIKITPLGENVVLHGALALAQRENI